MIAPFSRTGECGCTLQSYHHALFGIPGLAGLTSSDDLRKKDFSFHQLVQQPLSERSRSSVCADVDVRPPVHIPSGVKWDVKSFLNGSLSKQLKLRRIRPTRALALLTLQAICSSNKLRVYAHQGIFLIQIINFILIRIPPFMRFFSPFGSVLGQKMSKMGLFAKAKKTGLNFGESSRNFPNNI